jgi:hypothetical protein
MKKLKFDEKSLDALKSSEVTNMASVIGGQKYASTWSGGGSSGSDTVYWGPGETTRDMLNSNSSPCLYCDVVFNKIHPVGDTVTRFADFVCKDTF